MLVENIEALIQKLLCGWCVEHQCVCLEERTKKAESLRDLEKTSKRTDKRFENGHSYAKKRFQATKPQNDTSRMKSIENGANLSF